MASQSGMFNKTDLNSMTCIINNQKKFKNMMEFEFDATHGFTKYLNKSMLHEAGYDSYLTGVTFASIMK